LPLNGARVQFQLACGVDFGGDHSTAHWRLRVVRGPRFCRPLHVPGARDPTWLQTAVAGSEALLNRELRRPVSSYFVILMKTSSIVVPDTYGANALGSSTFLRTPSCYQGGTPYNPSLQVSHYIHRRRALRHPHRLSQCPERAEETAHWLFSAGRTAVQCRHRRADGVPAPTLCVREGAWVAGSVDAVVLFKTSVGK
jgi:hypothetical protein